MAPKFSVDDVGNSTRFTTELHPLLGKRNFLNSMLHKRKERTLSKYGQVVKVQASKVQIVSCTIAWIVQDFTYLGGNISRDGEITSEVTRRITRAARAFGCLRVPVFKNKDLSLATKRAVYRAVVLAVLLHGPETWTMKAVHIRRLNSFHNCCIRTILGVKRYQQWNERLTSQSLSYRFGLQHSISDIILEQRLRWLGHVGRMDEERLPNRFLFGELNMKRPCHGAKKRWRDVLKVDLQAIGV